MLMCIKPRPRLLTYFGVGLLAPIITTLGLTGFNTHKHTNLSKNSNERRKWGAILTISKF